MDMVVVQLDDGTGTIFDQTLRDNTLPDGGDLAFITKDDGTTSGKPILMMTFHVQLPDGTLRRAQCVTTLQNFLLAADIVRAKYLDPNRN